MNEFVYSFQLKNVYRTNSFLYYLKRFPLIKRLIPNDIYAKKGLKTFAKCLAFLYEFATLFIWKLLYLFLIFTIPSMMMETSVDLAASFHLFFFMTLIGGLLNTSLLNPTKDKYYAICLMRMDAKKIALSEFLYFQLKNLAGMGIAAFLIQLFIPLDFISCLSLSLLVVACKFIIAGLLLKKSQKKVYNENKGDILKLVLCLIFLGAAFVPFFFSMYMSMQIYYILCGIMLVVSLAAVAYLYKFEGYASIYKELLKPDNIVFDLAQVQKQGNKVFTEKIEYEYITTSKKGYAYLNQIFVQRHKRLLTKTANRIALGSLAVIVFLLLAVILVEPVRIGINTYLISFLPYSLFLMYLINRGESTTKAMFINCDNAMLHYRFYRQPSAILGMFKERLQSLILINLRPAAVIALGLTLLLVVSGGSTNVFDYVILPVTIICLSIFFSVHYLALYYLLQPYNSEVEMKNPLYTVITAFTYFVCYAFMQRIDSHYFGIWVIGLTIAYIIIALILTYRLASKSFRLK